MGVTYVPVARAAEIEDGQMKAVDLNGRPLILARSGGKYCLFARECPHEAADLLAGELTESVIRCESHLYEYDLASGECVNPADGPRLSVLAAEVQGDDVCLKLDW